MNLVPAAQREAHTLTLACNALWLATLSLMVAYMQTRAPAHRYLIARNVARNFETLQDEPSFSHESRESFRRLALRWTEKASLVAQQENLPVRNIGSLRPGFSN